MEIRVQSTQWQNALQSNMSEVQDLHRIIQEKEEQRVQWEAALEKKHKEVCVINKKELMGKKN